MDYIKVQDIVKHFQEALLKMVEKVGNQHILSAIFFFN